MTVVLNFALIQILLNATAFLLQNLNAVLFQEKGDGELRAIHVEHAERMTLLASKMGHVVAKFKGAHQEKIV